MAEQEKSITPEDQLSLNLPKEAWGRILILKISLILFFGVIAARLVQIQIVDSSKYKEIARHQYESPVKLPAARGNIYDRSGNILVSNTMYVSFAADPKIVGENADIVAEKFAQTFGKMKSFYLKKLQTPKRFVWLERRAAPVFSQKLLVEKMEGVIALNEWKRLYHYDGVAGQLLGFTDIDNNGLSGMELQMDKELRGRDGYVILQRDGLGRQRPAVDYPRVEPVNGNNVVLTIDLAYQSIAEEELKKGVERSQAESGLVVMLDPRTGEILAMAQYPQINPNDFTKCDFKDQRLRSVTDMFEPGSLFKIVTASAALEHHIVKLDQKFFAEHGEYRVPLVGRKVRIIRDAHDYDWLTFQEAMEVSSNIVMAKVSNEIGAERFYQSATDYGFGVTTGVDLPGEVRGELKPPEQWSGTTLNTISYGYEVGVTPLQVVCAYAAVANKGIKTKPYIVKKVINESEEEIRETKPQMVQRVVSEETTRRLTEFFEGVVERGTATSAKISGVRIAGKTGTSKRFQNGRYEEGNYTSSFVGYFPADDPEIVCLVMLDNPSMGGYFGGVISAPIFKAIGEKIINTPNSFPMKQQGILLSKGKSPQTERHGEELHVVPDVTNIKFEVAKKILEQYNFSLETLGEGELVLRQVPAPGETLGPGQTFKLFLTADNSPMASNYTIMPNLQGLSVRRAVNRLILNKLDVTVTGSGVVLAQSPNAGEKIKIGSRVKIFCESQSLPNGNLY